ncbi:MAG: glycoside hydrolase family 19 protein [Methylococcaceae bacterium]|jgi:putative chitinase
MLNIDKLAGHIRQSVLDELPRIHSITNDLRLCHFIAQCAYESNGFNGIFEDLNHSVHALETLFQKHFSHNQAIMYQHAPDAIANIAYADRMGNGNVASGDGYKFRGRGYIQLTGRENYEKFSEFVGDDCVNYPDLVATKYPLRSAEFFFNERNIWPICDRGFTSPVIATVSLKVNAAATGLPGRRKRFEEYWRLING